MCSGVPQSIAAAPCKNSRSMWKTNVLWASARVKNFIVQFGLLVESTASSDQGHGAGRVVRAGRGALAPALRREAAGQAGEDRKSARLNSSHLVISYAVFCLKKNTPDLVRCSDTS